MLATISVLGVVLMTSSTSTTKQSLPAPALAESMRVFLPALPPATPEPIELTDHHATTVTLESLALVDYSLMTMYGYELNRHEKALFFKIESTHRIGVLVRPADAPRLSWDEVLDAFARDAPAHNAPTVASDSESLAYEYPADWYRRAMLSFLPPAHSPVRVTWVAFGTQRFRPSPTIINGVYRWVNTGEIPIPPVPVTPALLHETGFVFGQVLIDPDSRSVTVEEHARK